MSLETSGALDVSDVDPRVVKVLDIKTPGSGEVYRNDWRNLNHLSSHDEVKFVICDAQDYAWAKMKIDEHGLAQHAGELLMSPSFEQVSARALAGWIVADRLPVRMQVQLHKALWGDEPGR